MVEPRWLNEDEARAWRGFVMTSQLLFTELDRQLQTDAGMGHADYQLLVALSGAPHRRLRMAPLAAFMSYSPSRVSHAVDRLERLGWVRRERDPDDGRGAVAVLTVAGLAALAGAAPGHVEAVRTYLLDQLSPTQVAQLGDICAAALDRLAARPPALPEGVLGGP